VPAIGKSVKRAYLVAAPKQSLTVSETGNGLLVKLPATATDPIATVVVLETK